MAKPKDFNSYYVDGNSEIHKIMDNAYRENITEQLKEEIENGKMENKRET